MKCIQRLHSFFMMILKSFILSLALSGSCFSSYAPSDKENSLNSKGSMQSHMTSFQGVKPPLRFHGVTQGVSTHSEIMASRPVQTTPVLNAASHTVQNTYPMPTLFHPQHLINSILNVQLYTAALMEIDIKNINVHYKTLYKNSENHPNKDWLRVVGFNVLQKRAIQEVMWINQKVMEFDILKSFAVEEKNDEGQKSFFSSMIHWENKRKPFLSWMDHSIMFKKDDSLYTQLNTIAHQYRGDLSIAELMMDDCLSQQQNPHAFPKPTQAFFDALSA